LHAFAKAAGLPPWSDTPRVYIPEATRIAVDRFGLPPRFIALHGVSSHPRKDWSREKWQTVLDFIWQAWELPVVEVGTTSAFVMRPHSVINLCGQSSILESAEVIRRAMLFIGVDSGPAHLANAVGTPGVVLLGQWVPFTGGYGDGSVGTLVHHSGQSVNEIGVDAVIDAVAARLAMAGHQATGRHK